MLWVLIRMSTHNIGFNEEINKITSYHQIHLLSVLLHKLNLIFFIIIVNLNTNPSFVRFLSILGLGDALGLFTGVELGVLGACCAIWGTF